MWFVKALWLKPCDGPCDCAQKRITLAETKQKRLKVTTK